MKYKRLNFEQYFIDTSKDFMNTGKARYKIVYNHVEYKGALLKHSAEWEMHYEKERQVIQINFEQTNGVLDWIENFKFPAKYYDSFEFEGAPIQLKVCKGWAEMYCAMKHDIRDKFAELIKAHPKAYVEIVGWSLGSALAQLCAQDLFYNFGKQSHLFTYGSVRPFYVSEEIRDNYLQKCCIEAYNFNHKSDIVGYQPGITGYHHINLVDLGKFSPIGIFNPRKYHTMYYEPSLYEGIS